MIRTRDTSAILNLSPSCFKRVQISFYFQKAQFFHRKFTSHSSKSLILSFLILRKSLKPNKKILSYLGSFQVRIRRDRGRRRSSHRQVRSRRAGRRRTVVPRDKPADEEAQHPDVQNVPKISRKQAELKREVAATKINNRLTQNAI
mgnify:CR=1 FL=1